MANYNISITANHTFAPQTQQVKSGDTVTWVDNDPDPNTSHTVTPDDPTAFQGSGDINAGDTFGPINFSGKIWRPHPKLPKSAPQNCVSRK